MLNKQTFAALILAAMFSCTASAQSSHAMQYVTQYGDAMGYTSSETPTKITEYLYGKDNRLERKVQTGRNSDATWNLINYYRYDYNEAGNLEKTNSLQYGLYDQNNWAFKASNDTVDYKYNEAGLLVQDYDHATKTTHDYEYDAQGRLVKDSRTRYYQYQNTYKTDLVINYSDFCDYGPQAISTEATSSYNVYTGKITYDTNGNKTSEIHWTVADEPVENWAEYWTYNEDGKLQTYEKKAFSSGKEINQSKTEYEYIDDNKYSYSSYTWGTDHWSFKPGSTTVVEYSDFDATKYAPEVLSVVADDANSQVKLTFTTPVANAIYNVYRDGILVGSTTNGEYTDTDVQNGDHEYFVQTVVDEVNYNVSNVATVTVARYFPHATNFRALTAAKTTEGTYNVTFAWTNPLFNDDMKFVNNNIVKIGTYYSTPLLDTGEEITDPTVNTITVSFGIDAVQTVYLQTRYAGGKVSSDTITVDASKIIGKVINNNRKLRVVETYGDAMGETAGMSKKTVNYYGENNRLERVAKYSNAVSEDPDAVDLTIYEYTSYIYDETGMLVKSYENQYGRYDYGDMGFQAAQDTTYYENNLEGQTTKEYNSNGYTTYEYNNAGSVVKKYTIEFGTTNVEQTIEYSNFVGKDLPQTTVSTGTRTAANYKLETTYNADGKKLTEKKTMDQPSSSYPSTYESIEYNADGDISVDSVFTIKIVNDVETLVEKSYTTYTPEEDNSDRVVVVKKVWDNILKKFGNPKTYDIYEYTDIDAEKYAPTLDIEPVEDELNTVKLIVDLPYLLQNGMTALNVYRDGIEIAHAINYFDDDHYTTNEYGTQGVWTYDDTTVNGTHDYYVEYARLDATLQNETSVHNISNIVSYIFDLPLPRVTGLEVTDARYTTVQNTTDDGTVDEVEAFATLNWQAPVDAQEYGIKQYRVMVVGMSIGENDDVKDPLATTYELDMRGRDSITVYIQGVYKYGRSASDSILVTESQLKEIADKIETVNSELTTQDSRLYNLAGQQIGKNAKGIVITKNKKYLAK